MNYIRDLILRLIVVTLFPYKLLLPIFTFITIHISTLLLFPYSPIIKENSIVISNITLKFVPACIAITAYYLLTFLVIITKDIKLKTRIKMWLLGTSLILIANLIRILILSILLIKQNINLFLTLHLIIWELIASIYIFLIWILLTKLYKVKSIPIYDDIKELIKIIKTSR